MKRLMVVLLAMVFLFAGTAFAAEKTKGAAKPAPAKAAKMTAVGTVLEISDKTLKLDRKGKEKSELMDFALDKPAADVKAGDKVKVHYTVKDGKNIATKVTKATTKAKEKTPKKK
ncbi:MAG: hypothetical protein AB1512_24105 [Thermodesulfobacteriota bacterium]